MLTSIKISGFKSFQDFHMEFAPLTVIAGANASGKSNLFDALKLLARLAEVDLRTAFAEQRGNPSELFTQFSDQDFAQSMSFEIEMLLNRQVRDNWGGEVQLRYTRLKYELHLERRMNEKGFEDLFVTHESLERIRSEDDIWAKRYKQVKELIKTLGGGGGTKEPYIKTETEGNKTAIKIRQDGRQGGRATPADSISQTVLGGVNTVDFPHVFAVKEEMRSWQFLHLNPSDLREPTLKEPGMRDTIGVSGKNLAAALFRIKQNDPYALSEISRKLNKFLPNFVKVDVVDDKSTQQYIIKLYGEDGREFSSRVLSEGTLRILTLCILEQDEKHAGLLCFEEPENGINPFRISTMVALLKDLSVDFSDPDDLLRQVIVNTHSPKLVSQMQQWSDNLYVAVYYAEMTTRIDGIRKIKYEISKITPVLKEANTQLALSLSESERKLTLKTVEHYLQAEEELQV
jgi:predicted ATPase